MVFGRRKQIQLLIDEIFKNIRMSSSDEGDLSYLKHWNKLYYRKTRAHRGTNSWYPNYLHTRAKISLPHKMEQNYCPIFIEVLLNGTNALNFPSLNDDSTVVIIAVDKSKNIKTDWNNNADVFLNRKLKVWSEMKRIWYLRLKLNQADEKITQSEFMMCVFLPLHMLYKLHG